MERIRIIATPPGQAPESVRDQWVGLELPLSEPLNGKVRGVLDFRPTPGNPEVFCVNGETALELLAKKSPEAATWWLKNAPMVTAGQLAFLREVCELVPDKE